MNVFELVRTNISARDAAEHYGLKVNRKGMACCPFHQDKHPSMKLDQRYHCFGCQEDGDAVNYVAKLFGLGNYDAALKLLDDFGITYKKDSGLASRKSKKTDEMDKQKASELRIRKVENQLRNWMSYAVETLLKYQHLLQLWKEQYRPKTENEEWHPLFVEALQMMTVNEYHLDILLTGTDEERLDFFVMRGRG